MKSDHVLELNIVAFVYEVSSADPVNIQLELYGVHI